MTATDRRPGPVPVALLAYFAVVMVVAFARGEFAIAWFVGLGGSFLTMELWHACTCSGDTFSEDWWAILGIRPPRPHRMVRTSLAGVFIAELGLHITLGGAYWFCGAWAIGGTAVPLAGVVGYSLIVERRASVGIWSDVKTLWKLRAARERLREAGKMGKLKTVGFALVGAVLAGAVAQVTGACPDLISAVPAIVMAGVGGGITYLMRKPLASPGTKALLTGCGAVVVGAVVQQVNAVCGPGFVDKVPSLAMAGAWVGLGLWLKAPHESPGLGSVTPPALKG